MLTILSTYNYCIHVTIRRINHTVSKVTSKIALTRYPCYELLSLIVLGRQPIFPVVYPVRYWCLTFRMSIRNWLQEMNIVAVWILWSTPRNVFCSVLPWSSCRDRCIIQSEICRPFSSFNLCGVAGLAETFHLSLSVAHSSLMFPAFRSLLAV